MKKKFQLNDVYRKNILFAAGVIFLLLGSVYFILKIQNLYSVKNSEPETEEVTVDSTTSSREKTEATEKPKKENGEESFLNNKLITADYEIKIKESKIMKNEYSEKLYIVIVYDFKNTSQKELVPSTSFRRSFTATQDLGDTINDLNDGFVFSDSEWEEKYSVSSAKVKSGKTVETVATFELKKDSGTVTLTATNTKNKNELGSKNYKIEENETNKKQKKTEDTEDDFEKETNL